MDVRCRLMWLAAASAILGLAGVPVDRAAAEEQANGPSAFQPGDISIGEPIALPFAQPSSTPNAGTRTAPQPATPAAPGWLGMSVAESTQPGRWAIVEVTPAGPAAAAGILSGDELRGVNGRPLTNGDDVAEAITIITAGQRVKLSVARAEQLIDVEVLALPRPPVGIGGNAAAEPSVPGAAPFPPLTTTMASPPTGLAPGPGWQSSAEMRVPPPSAAPDGGATVSVLTNPPTAMPAASSPPTATTSPRPPSTLPVATPASIGATPRGRTALGVRTVPIDRGIQERFHLPQPSGAYVVGVVGDLPASKAGIPPGSVIVSLADRPVRSPQELTQLVAAGPTDRPLPLRYVLPGGAEKRADVVLQSLELPLEQALVGPPVPQPSAAPQLEPSPTVRTSRRVEPASDTETGELRREVGRLRALLEAVERRLERLGVR